MNRALALLWLLACTAITSSAQLPTAKLLTVFPPGAKSGSTIEVSVSGQDLDGVEELRFSHHGITATAKGTNRFEAAIERDVPPGIYDVRAVGKYGVSNPRAFAVGTLGEITEAKNSSDSPQTVPLESTVNGRTEANAVDYFHFQASRGQFVLVRCETRAIDSKLEPVLELYDGAGREAGHSRSGGMLEHFVAEDGEFTLRLHDLTYRGGPEFFYRLSLGTFPGVDYLLPIAGEAGGKTKFVIYGHNLPGGKMTNENATPPLERIEVELAENDPGLTRPLTTMPAQAGLDLFEYRVRNERGISDPVLIRFPSGPVIAEEEPNNKPSMAQKIAVPCEIFGQFHPNGDHDCFSFEAKKGDVYWIEVVSHRLGLPTDPLLVVQRAGPKGMTDVLEMNDSEPNVGGTEFNTAHRDPSGRLEIKEDGTYLLQVRDLFTHPQHNPALAYQLAIRRAAPDFRLIALPAPLVSAKKDAKDVLLATMSLRRGETLPIKVMALRRDGFGEAIEVSAKNLPPGISAAPARIEAGKNSALVLLSAAEDVAGSSDYVKVFGTASVNGTNLVHEARPASLAWNVADPAEAPVLSRASANGVVSTIAEMVPVRLTVTAEKPFEGVAGGKVKIPLKLEREGEFTANLKLKPVGVAGLESAKEFDLDPKSTNVVYEVDLGQQKLAPGTYVFALQGVVTGKPMKSGKGGKKKPGGETAFTLYSAPITLKVTAAPTNSPAK